MRRNDSSVDMTSGGNATIEERAVRRSAPEPFGKAFSCQLAAPRSKDVGRITSKDRENNTVDLKTMYVVNKNHTQISHTHTHPLPYTHTIHHHHHNKLTIINNALIRITVIHIHFRLSMDG